MDRILSQLVEFLDQEHRGCISEFETCRNPHIPDKCEICILLNKVRAAEDCGAKPVQRITGKVAQ